MELRDEEHCFSNTASKFNVSAGNNGTVIFHVVSDHPAGTQGLCIDFNRDLQIVETYEW